jgi:hypothetical protein
LPLALVFLLFWGFVDDFVVSAVVTGPGEECQSGEDDEYAPSAGPVRHWLTSGDGVPLPLREPVRQASSSKIPRAGGWLLERGAFPVGDPLSFFMSWQC